MTIISNNFTNSFICDLDLGYHCLCVIGVNYYFAQLRFYFTNINNPFFWILNLIYLIYLDDFDIRVFQNCPRNIDMLVYRRRESSLLLITPEYARCQLVQYTHRNQIYLIITKPLL